MADGVDPDDLSLLRGEIRRLQTSIYIIHAELAAQRTIQLSQATLIDELFGDFALPLAELLKLERASSAREGLEAKAAFIERFVDELGNSFDIPAND